MRASDPRTFGRRVASSSCAPWRKEDDVDVLQGVERCWNQQADFQDTGIIYYIHRVHPGLGLVWETSWKKHIRIWDSRPVASDFAGSVRWGMKISTSDWDFCWFSSYVHSPRGKWLQAAWEYPLKLWSNGDDGGRGDPKIPFGNFNLRSQPHV